MKIIYNLTIKVAQEIESDLISELKESIIPNLTDGHIIESAQINKLVLPQPEEENTYALQFLFSTEALFKEFRLKKMEECLNGIDAKFRGKYVYFATTMELIHYHNNDD